MLAYSARKIKANPTLPYSILKPETNSDSPSAKSNGARFVSATQVTNHNKAAGNIKNINQSVLCPSVISVNLKLHNKNKGNNKIRAILIS